MSIECCDTCLDYFDLDIEGGYVDDIPYCEYCIPPEEENGIWRDADDELAGGNK